MKYLYKKGKDEKYYFIYTYDFVHCTDMHNKITATKNNGLGENLKY